MLLGVVLGCDSANRKLEDVVCVAKKHEVHMYGKEKNQQLLTLITLITLRAQTETIGSTNHIDSGSTPDSYSDSNSKTGATRQAVWLRLPSRCPWHR